MSANRVAQPWYRQPWPWLLMAGPATVIVAGIVTTVIAFTGADGVVADDYYKRGLAINRTLAREARAAELGIAAEVRLLPGRVVADVTARTALPERIQLTLAHPTRAGEDRVVFLARAAGGGYEAPLGPMAAGRWRVILETPEWRWSALAGARG
jgi:uncharacterized protein